MTTPFATQLTNLFSEFNVCLVWNNNNRSARCEVMVSLKGDSHYDAAIKLAYSMTGSDQKISASGELMKRNFSISNTTNLDAMEEISRLTRVAISQDYLNMFEASARLKIANA